MFFPQRWSLSMLQTRSGLLTRGEVGKASESPEHGGNWNKIQKSAKMTNIAWKRKIKDEKLAVFLSQRSVNFHSWNVKTLWKSRICIYSEEIKNTWELLRDGNHVTYHRQENCFFTDLAEKNRGQKHHQHHCHHHRHDHQHAITTANTDWLFLVPGTAQTSLQRISAVVPSPPKLLPSRLLALTGHYYCRYCTKFSKHLTESLPQLYEGDKSNGF